MNRRLNSFSLVELLVVLTIAAILMGLGAFGMSVAQRNARDEDRKVTVSQIASAANEYYRENGVYPTAANVVWQTNNVRLGNEMVELRGTNKYSTANVTDAGQTRYFYQKDDRGYVVCALLESGSWHKQGSGTTACPN